MTDKRHSPRTAFAICRMTLALLLAPMLLASNCFNAPGNNPDPGNGTGDPIIDITPGSPPANFDLNGQWRYEASGGLAAGCITISGLRITVLDNGCNGNNLALVNNPPAYTYGDNADIYCSYNVDPNNPTIYGLWSYNLALQPDGSLQGQAIHRLEPSGTVTQADVNWRRQ